MSDAVAAAIISGCVSLVVGIVSALLAAKSTGNDVTKKMEIAQAVTDTKLEELTREVRAHNGFAQRLPVVEEQIKAANRRIDDIEKAANK